MCVCDILSKFVEKKLDVPIVFLSDLKRSTNDESFHSFSFLNFIFVLITLHYIYLYIAKVLTFKPRERFIDIGFDDSKGNPNKIINLQQTASP